MVPYKSQNFRENYSVQGQVFLLEVRNGREIMKLIGCNIHIRKVQKPKCNDQINDLLNNDRTVM